jgi:hypothetical protein
VYCFLFLFIYLFFFFLCFKTATFVLMKGWINPSPSSNYSTCAVLLKYSTEAGSMFHLSFVELVITEWSIFHFHLFVSVVIVMVR